MHVEAYDTPGQLAARIRTESRGRVARRLTAVRLAMLGHTAPWVAGQVLLSERQVRTWVARYNAGGAAALADRAGRGRKGPLTPDQEGRLRGRLRAGPTEADGACALRGADVRRIRAGEFGVLRSLQAVYGLLHRPGFEPSRPRPRHPRAVARITAAHPGERVEVWFEDEARFGQRGTLTRVWAERGSRPAAPRQVGYANLRVLTAACPATGRAEGLVSQRLDAGVVQLFLDQLSATVPAGVHVALVWGGAGWHTAGRVRAPANVTLVPLPAYAPELNPVERLWHYLREHHWSNRVYSNVDALEEAAVAGWRAACLNPGVIRTVCRCEYTQTGS